jgi:hypothetical protein
VKHAHAFLFVCLALLLSGCGGGKNKVPGSISGVIFDINGEVVRNARVWCDLSGPNDPETRSNASGAYLLTGVPESIQIVRAEVTQNGLRYYGQTAIQVFEGDQTKNVNITLVRDNQLASVVGVVMDRNGFAISGAKVFANSNGFSSSFAITASDGTYAMGGLQAGLDYTLTASARYYGNDEDFVNLSPGEQRNVNFILGNVSNVQLPAPQNLSAVAWTSPKEITTRGREADAIEAFKQKYDPRRAQGRTRNSDGGNWIEIDLYWDAVSSPQLMGYGIYRGTSAVDALQGLFFLRDIYATFFADLDELLRENQTYYYEVTALNTSYPDSAGSESNHSNRYGVTPIGDLALGNVTQNPSPVFNWQAANGAQSYIVFLFDAYPTFETDFFWQSAPTASTQLAYTGPALTPGHTYYYLVLGLANGNDSRTISRVGSFVKN